MRKTPYIITLSCVLGLLLLGSCSTKKNTFTRRAFHNLTSHYNVFWNGEYSLKEGDKNLRESVKDDYTKVLRVYNYGTQSEGMALNSQMDRALEKTSICVQKHSMKFNSRERVRWIDDAYLVMAKAHFYKHDYIPARRTFDFVATEYNYNDISYVANMWLIKTYIQTEQYSKAVALIEQLQTKVSGLEKSPKELNENFDFTIADYYIATEDYGNAIKYLHNGILLNKDRDLRTRAMFILGQIYMLQNDANRATEQFKKVVKRNPPYEMSFEAKMNMAKMGSSSNAKELYKMLTKMLNDANNEDYRDRIYYAMAELALREGDQDKALRYLRKSVAAFKDNKSQRTLSSLKAATMFFERNDYELAQAYYDTAVTSMDKEYKGYDSIVNLSQTLNELVLHLTTIRDQDSLLRVAAMDENSRNKIIDKIIADLIEQEKYEEERRQYEEQLALMGAATGDAPKPQEENGMKPGESSWYYYNQATVSRGYTEFTKKWGMRKLEDNWFIIDKKSISSGMMAEEGEEQGDEIQDDTLTSSNDPHQRGYYLTDLPFKPEQKAVCDSLIRESLYQVGFVYMDRLSDYQRSVESYETLDTRYPENEHELPSWYALYKMYRDNLANEEKASIYKEKIFKKYPESSYAEFIKDPDYYKKLEEQEKESSDFYAKTYEAFQQGQYYRVKMNTERAMEMYEADTALMPRFAFLNAVARGRLESIDTMAYALYNLVRDYPTSSIKPYAFQVLENINTEYNIGLVLTDINSKENGEQPEVKKATPYVYEPNSEHFVMIICNSKLVRVDPLMVRISDFNKKEHRTKSFNVKNVILDDNRMMITIGNFNGVTEAENYVTSMFLTDYVFGGIEKNNYSIHPISIKNYPLFYQAKDMDEYIQFINDNK